ncbi:MAG: glycosyltransferase family 4 protein [Chitinophagales bacterium]|nr:glycosyltransferase family 4 protein [Chitinophagales bacterium]
MSNKLSILYIGNKLAVHGRTPTSIDTLGKLLEEEGHTLYYSSSKLKQRSRMLDMLSAIWKYRGKVDVVLIDTYSTAAFNFAWACGRLCKMLGVKYIPILHGGNLPERFKNSPRKCRQLFGRAFTNVTVSAYLQDHLVNAGYKGVTIGNAITFEKYPYKERSRIQPYILWVRAFHTTYNPEMAILAFEMFVKEFPNAKLTMVGPDVDGSMILCKQLVKDYKLEGKVQFTGKLSKEEWIQLAQDCNMFINTSNFDNQPVSIIEAMALGLPIISTNVGGIPYMLTHTATGMLIPRDNPEALCNAMTLLMHDAKIANRLSMNGRKYAVQFDWDILKNKWEQLFASV